MISLKKHMDAYGEELAKAAVTAYRATLSTMGKAAVRATPDLGTALAEKLESVQNQLTNGVTRDQITEAQRSVDRELTRWSESAAEYSTVKAKEIREIMVAVATAATAAGERDKRYSQRFSGLTTKLQSIARLEDLSSIRSSVLESATELKTVVAKMVEEGDSSMAKLRAEVANYRTKLEQSRQRESTDALTGLANRRAIEAQIDERISWKQQFCLAMLDLNGFKQVNDEHGHMAGDDLLKQFATEMKTHFRATDLVGRWGGDEFVILIDSDLAEARNALDRLREWSLGSYVISDGKHTANVTLTASIGVAEWDRNETALDLLGRADLQMYEEKKVTSIRRKVVA